MGFTPHKTEQLIQDTDLQKEENKDKKHARKLIR